MMLLVSWIFVRSQPRSIDRWFRRLQLVSASLYSLGHGGNDAQKTMGLIWMLLIASGYAMDDGHLPVWVIVCCYGAIGVGTLFGGWRIVKTMGQKITKLKPVGGFCAETGGALTLFVATALGIPDFNNPYHHRRYCRRGFLTENVGSQMGRRQQYCLGVDPDDSCVGISCRNCMVAW